MKILFAAAMTAAAIVIGPTANAADFTKGDIKVSTPWTRATPSGARVAGGFMTITNTGKQSDRLVGGSVPFAGAFEVHEMKMTDGVMKMRMLSKGLEIKPGQTVTLKPGSYHVMFLKLKQPLKPGEKVKGTLVFEKAGTVEIEYAVARIGAMSPSGKAGDGGHGHMMKH
ncbi:MAG: copper chaperone PCu(A)C [Hyphomicrobiaceae bacterium]